MRSPMPPALLLILAASFLAPISSGVDWNNFRLPAGLVKAKESFNAKNDLPWWHVKSAARAKEQNVALRTCGDDCTGQPINPLCVGVKGQKKVFHQFWNSCEFANYVKCNRVGSLMYVIEKNYCESTVSKECKRMDCSRKSVRPVCSTGDPKNEDYTYANLCFYEVAACVARANRGALTRAQPGRCPNPNPHRFPSNFHRNWFIKM